MKTTQTIKLILTSLMLTVGLHSVAAPLSEKDLQNPFYIGLFCVYAALGAGCSYAIFMNKSPDQFSVVSSWQRIQELHKKRLNILPTTEKSELNWELAKAYSSGLVSLAMGTTSAAISATLFFCAAKGCMQAMQNRT